MQHFAVCSLLIQLLRSVTLLLFHVTSTALSSPPFPYQPCQNSIPSPVFSISCLLPSTESFSPDILTTMLWLRFLWFINLGQDRPIGLGNDRAYWPRQLTIMSRHHVYRIAPDHRIAASIAQPRSEVRALTVILLVITKLLCNKDTYRKKNSCDNALQTQRWNVNCNEQKLSYRAMLLRNMQLFQVTVCNFSNLDLECL